MKKIYLFILFGLLYDFIVLHAQNPDLPKNLPSPNVQSFIEYGNHNVDLYNGKPDISVPIYTLNYFDIPLEVSLSYASKAIQVNDIPGWVGLNWNLNAGGVIYRSKKEHLDERDDYKVGSQPFPSDGFFKAYNLLNNDNWLNKTFIDNLILKSDNTGDGLKRQFRTDYHPDIFYFNFMGISGKFFMGNDGNFKIQSEHNLKIDIHKEDFKFPFNKEYVPFNNFGYNAVVQIPVTQLKQIYKITLTDESGNQYIFGNNYNNIEYSTNFFSQVLNGQWDADSWYLSEVKNRFGKVVYKFHYDRIDYISKFYKSYSLKERKASGKILGTWMECLEGSGSTNGYEGRLISPVYLNKIETPDGNIEFYKSQSFAKNYKSEKDDLYNYLMKYSTINNSPNYVYLLSSTDTSNNVYFNNSGKFQKLNTIKGFGKLIRFNYKGENGNTDSKTSSRLTLSSLDIDNQKYSFDYYYSERLPNYLSLTSDHWGNYNGIEDNTPSLNESTFSNFDKTRKLDHDKVKYGILTKIKYPTGGTTIYDWEANSYTSYLSDDKKSLINTNNIEYGGGIRIKSINDYDHSNQLKTRNFLYTSNNSSSGILENKPTYIWKNFIINGSNADKLSSSSTVFSNNVLFTLSNYSGTSVNYPVVSEVLPDNSYIEHKFTSNREADYRDQIIIYEANLNISPYVSLSDRSHLRGRNLETNYYDTNGEKKRSIRYNYNPIDDNQYVKAFTFEQWQCATFGSPFLFIKPVKLYYNELETNSIIDEEITPDGLLSKETYYKYIGTDKYNINGYKKYLKNEEIYLNKTTNESKNIEYSYSFEGDNFQKNNYYNLGINEIISTKESVKNNNLYQDISLLSVENKNFTSNPVDYLPHIYKKSKGGGILYLTTIIDSYEPFTTKINQFHLPNSEVYTTYIYYRDKIVAKLIGSKIDLPNTNFDQIKNKIDKLILNFSDWKNKRNLIMNELNNLRLHYPDHLITTYTYLPLSGLTMKTEPNGISEFYNYDEFGRLADIRNDKNELIKKIEYNFSNGKNIFYNEQIDLAIYKQCNNNEFSDPITYTIPPNKYESLISIDDANLVAKNFEQKSAQNYANNVGSCSLYECRFDKTKDFTFAFTSLSKFDPNTIRLQFAIYISVADVTNPKNNWNQGVYIGYLTGTCLPSKREYFTSKMSGSNVEVGGYIEPTGALYITLKNYIANNYIQADIKYNRK